MNIYDIANAAGVSIATVSRVLNDGVVGKKTRERVLRVMEEMGYTPNAFARGLGLGTMNTVGVVVSNIYDLYFARAISVLEDKLRRHGYDLILCCVSGDAKDRRKYFHLLSAKKVDAAILIGSRFAERDTVPSVLELAEKMPVISVGGYIEGAGVYNVVCDDREAVYSAVKALNAKGHTDFLYLYDSVSPSGLNKRKGFIDGLKECGIAQDDKRMIRCQRDIDEAKNCVGATLSSGLKITAILTSEDELAVGAMQYAAENNVNVPQELAIVGYNNSTLSRATNPPLSSIDNKVDIMSGMAVQILTNIFEEQNPPNKVMISAELVERFTT